MLPKPPSKLWWEWDSLQRGHHPSETIAYASWCADYEDEQQERHRSLPAGFVPAECESRLLTRLRRIFRR